MIMWGSKLLLSNINIRAKLIIFVMPFAMLTAVFLAQLAWQQYQTLQTLSGEKQLADVAYVSINLIDSLQFERGLSNGFLSAKQASPSAMLAARKLTNANLAAFKRQETAPSVRSLKLRVFSTEVEALLAKRTAIDSRTISAPMAFAAYSQAIASLVTITNTLHSASTHSSLLSNYSGALSNLSCAKEMAGRERGLVNGMLAQGVFSQAQLLEAAGYHAGMKACLTQTLELAPRAIHARLKKSVFSPSRSSLQSLREQIYSTKPGQPVHVTAKHWFDEASIYITELKQVQFQVSKDFQSTTTQLASDFEEQLLTKLLIISTILCGLLFCGYLVYGSIRDPIYELETLMTELSRELELDRRANLAGKDEIGKMGKAFNLFLDAYEDSYDTLINAQKTLVESEKLASLGGLVAGVAHEINTPVGIALTVSSSLHNTTQKFYAKLETGTIKKSDLQRYLVMAKESCELILDNIQRAAELIHSFKQVAADHTSEIRRSFNLSEYVQEIILSLRPKFKDTQIVLHLEVEPNLLMDSFPGAISRVITNLLTNTLIHAFEDGQPGKVQINVQRVDAERLRLTVSDNGRGIASENLDKIFMPFFTTTRSLGHCGLGLHIVYNNVRQSLSGSIEVSSVLGEGTTFVITMPCITPAKPL